MMERHYTNVESLHEGLIIDPNDTRFDDEHALSIQTAQVLEDLDQLQNHLDPAYKTKMDESEAQRLRLLVEDTYHAHFATQDRQRHNRDLSRSCVRPLEREIGAISSNLRSVWRESYYEPRTREASREDFQMWLDSYIVKYGEEALEKTTRVESAFLSAYRFTRTSTSDILLIAGCGAKSIDVIETTGTRVSRALPESNDHHTIYTLQISPEDWIGQIRIPSDIRRPHPHAITL